MRISYRTLRKLQQMYVVYLRLSELELDSRYDTRYQTQSFMLNTV